MYWILLCPLALSWIIFCLGAAAEMWRRWGDARGPTILLVAGAGAPLLARLVWNQSLRWRPRWSKLLERHARKIDSLPMRLDWLWIALGAGLGLYLELAMIRFHGCCFQLFAFFKNLSMLSCFLGLGIGYAISRRRALLTPIVLPLIAGQMLLLHCLRYTSIGELLHNPVSENISLGMAEASDWIHAVTAYGFLLFIFCVNAIAFVPLGQLAARLMARRGRLEAYGWNLLGSLAGISLFYLISWLCAPPAAWMALGSIGLLILLPDARAASAAIALVLVAVLTINWSVNQYDLYSPYQIITVTQSNRPYPEVRVNHVYFQQIFKLDEPVHDDRALAAQRYYNLPYASWAGAAKKVLIVGSGTGNDVAAAVRHGAAWIDAVEIDPTILALGQRIHPERPYASVHVHAHVDDARHFIRNTNQQYDRIVYGLLDSHALLSGLSAVRLDSYVYTVQAFKEARAKLEPGGKIFLAFTMIRPELGRKLYLMLRDAFDGHPPVVLRTVYDGGVTFIAGEHLDRRAIDAATAGDFLDVTDILAADGSNGNGFSADESTDDWPFFYMPRRSYPLTYAIMIATVLIISAAYVYGFLGHDAELDVTENVAEVKSRFAAPFFLLGAGFMLLETKAITELALYYGGTWVVVGIVIAAILVMAYLANLLLLIGLRLPPVIAYPLLLVSIAAQLMISRHGLSPIMATALLTLPMFFAGLAFSAELRRAASLPTALSSNLLGAMVGGCLEYNSMYFGFRALAYMAIAIYAGAFLASMVAMRRRAKASTTPAYHLAEMTA
jgi:SAM-dependent methyltransferase